MKTNTYGLLFLALLLLAAGSVIDSYAALANGKLCSSGSDCNSGKCINGVCCGANQCAKAVSGLKGSCFDVGVQNSLESGVIYTCRSEGVWKLSNKEICSGNVDCNSGKCLNGVCCAANQCGKAISDLRGSCFDVGVQNSLESGVTYTCRSEGVWKLSNKELCSSDSECLSGECANDVCCARGQCGYAVTDFYGRCLNVNEFIRSVDSTFYCLGDAKLEDISQSYKFYELNTIDGWNRWSKAMNDNANCPLEMGPGKANVQACCKDQADCLKVRGYYQMDLWLYISDKDLKLVDAKGSILGNTMCVGDSFTLSEGLDKGEYLHPGGYFDTPPIYFSADVEKFVQDLVDYHKSGVHKDVTVPFSAGILLDGMKDPLTKVPLYTNATAASASDTLEAAEITGNLVCTVKQVSENVSQSSEILKKSNTGYVAMMPGDVSFNAKYAVECTFYHYGSKCEASGSWDSFCRYNVPSVLDRVDAKSIEDLLRIKYISYSKRISVIGGNVTPSLAGSVYGAEKLNYSKSGVLRAVIVNSGNVKLESLSLSSPSKYRFISCSATNLEPGQSAECLINVTVEKTDKTVLYANYAYASACLGYKSGQAELPFTIGNGSTSTTTTPTSSSSSTTTSSSTTSTLPLPPHAVRLSFRVSDPYSSSFNCSVWTNISGGELSIEENLQGIYAGTHSVEYLDMAPGMYAWTVNCSNGKKAVYPKNAERVGSGEKPYWIFYVSE